MSEVIIRKYIDSDRTNLIDAMRALRYFLIPLNPDRKSEISQDYFEQYIEEVLTELMLAEAIILVAEHNGLIVGYIHGVLKRTTKLDQLQFKTTVVGEVVDLYVNPDYQGQRIGSHLTNAAIPFFKENGCKSMSLDVLTNNKAAITFYEKLGFVTESQEMMKKI